MGCCAAKKKVGSRGLLLLVESGGSVPDTIFTLIRPDRATHHPSNNSLAHPRSLLLGKISQLSSLQSSLGIIRVGVRDRPADDVEITPEVMATGMAVLWEICLPLIFDALPGETEELLTRLFRAMVRVQKSERGADVIPNQFSQKTQMIGQNTPS